MFSESTSVSSVARSNSVQPSATLTTGASGSPASVLRQASEGVSMSRCLRNYVNNGTVVSYVTSPKGLQSWKHRFAVNRALSCGFVGPAGPHPLRFGSIGLHGVRIGSIPLQSLQLACGLQAEEKPRRRPRLRQLWRGDPGHSARFCKAMVPTLQTYG